jgi:putative hydrolase of the HAD superfamily
MIVHSEQAFRDPPACVLLDLDNTFYDYDPCNVAGMEAAQRLAQAQLMVQADQFEASFLRARREIKEALGDTPSSHNRLLYFQRTLEIAGFASQPYVSLQLEQAYWRAYLEVATLFEDALEFLDDLRMANIPAVIVTDLTAQIQMRKIIRLGLEKDIDWLVTSEEIGADKPDPRMFTTALKKVEVAQGPIWMIGDSLEKDVAGARAAVGAVGIQKVHGDLKPARSAAEADATFKDFSGLRKLFSRLVTERSPA